MSVLFKPLLFWDLALYADEPTSNEIFARRRYYV